VDDGAAPAGSGESNIALVRVMVRPPLTKKLSSSTCIKASEDDAYATRQNATNSYTQPTLLLGLNSAGMRFGGINIPQGSKILSARLTVRVSMWLPQGIAGIVQAEATGNAAGFSLNDRRVGELPLTDAFVDWIWSPGSYYGEWNNSGTVCVSPDLCDVVQEVVDRPDWAAGNAIALVLWSQNIPRAELQIVSYDNSPATAAMTAPTLSISYASSDPEAAGNSEVPPSIPADAITRLFTVGGVSDDASASGGMTSVFDQYLKVGAKQMSAMRFAGVNIPRGVRVFKAQLRVSPPTTHLADRLEGLVQAEATGNAPNFLGDGRHLYNLPRTDASVAWIWEPGTYGGYDSGMMYKASPDISAVVQEVLDRQDWSAGNALDILFSCTNQPSQDLQFVAYGFLGPYSSYYDPSKYPPAALEITYAP